MLRTSAAIFALILPACLEPYEDEAGVNGKRDEVELEESEIPEGLESGVVTLHAVSGDHALYVALFVDGQMKPRSIFRNVERNDGQKTKEEVYGRLGLAGPIPLSLTGAKGTVVDWYLQCSDKPCTSQQGRLAGAKWKNYNHKEQALNELSLAVAIPTNVTNNAYNDVCPVPVGFSEGAGIAVMFGQLATKPARKLSAAALLQPATVIQGAFSKTIAPGDVKLSGCFVEGAYLK